MNQLSLSIEEASAATGIGRTKIYELIGSGQLMARKLGSRTIILKSDIEAFLAGLDQYQTSGAASKVSSEPRGEDVGVASEAQSAK